jgi:hypothetical protein
MLGRAKGTRNKESAFYHVEGPSRSCIASLGAIDPSPRDPVGMPVVDPPQLKSLDSKAGLKPKPLILPDLPLWTRC